MRAKTTVLSETVFGPFPKISATSKPTRICTTSFLSRSNGGHFQRGGTNLGVFVPIWLILPRCEAASLGVFDLCHFALLKRVCANSVVGLELAENHFQRVCLSEGTKTVRSLRRERKTQKSSLISKEKVNKVRYVVFLPCLELKDFPPLQFFGPNGRAGRRTAELSCSPATGTLLQFTLLRGYLLLPRKSNPDSTSTPLTKAVEVHPPKLRWWTLPNYLFCEGQKVPQSPKPRKVQSNEKVTLGVDPKVTKKTKK